MSPFFGRPRNEAKVAELTVPDTPEALAEFLSDQENWAKLGKDPQARVDFLTAYNKNVNKGETISRQIDDAVGKATEKISAEWISALKEEGLVGRPDLSELTDELKRFAPGQSPAAKSPLYNPKAMGASIDNEFENSADYFKTIWHNTDRTPEIQTKLSRIRNAFSSNVPSEGGFLIPENLRSELLRVALETAVVRPRARVVPMESLRVPFPAIDSTSNASSVFGGVIGYWTEEGGALTDSSPSFGRIVLEAKKLTAYTEVPNELISDSAISFQAFIDDIFPQALAFYEDLAFFNGTGAGEPLGFLRADAEIQVTKESGQLADTIVWENIVKMYSRMLPSSLGRAVWITSPGTFVELATMALSVGTGGSAIWLTNGVGQPPMSILGRPVIVSEKAPVLGDAGDIGFYDFDFYLVGDRQVMTASSSEHFKFKNDQTAYRIIERVDGRPWLNSAITPQNSGDTLSPFVQIAARA
jgi:HK97 family phage major capsid protein